MTEHTNNRNATSHLAPERRHVYEKPVLRPLGHMARVTQKSGPTPDGGSGQSQP